MAVPSGLAFSQEAWPDHWNGIPANHAVGVDLDTGMTMFARNADSRIEPASMVKMMTVYLLFERIRSGSLDLDDAISVSEKAWRMKGSRMFLDPGSRVKVRDILLGVIVSSGNDAAVAIAEHLAVEEGGFVEIMNAKAHEIGMKNTHYANASGWPDPEQYSTVRDLAILVARTLEDFPQLSRFYTETTHSHNNIRQSNRNTLLGKPGLGVLGMKTGHTENSGYSLALAAERDGRRVAVVISGASSKKERSRFGEFLVDHALREWKNVSLFRSGETVAMAHVAGGLDKQIPLAVHDSILITLPLFRPLKPADLQVHARFDDWVQAPIARDTAMGTLEIKTPGQTFRYPLYSQGSTAAASFWQKAWQGWKLYLQKFSFALDSNSSADSLGRPLP